MKQPLITVITAVKNSRETIARTLDSILGQTYPNVELIVVDGGSTDGTTDIIERYRPRLAAYVSEPDRGVYDAMNKGINLSHGALSTS